VGRLVRKHKRKSLPHCATGIWRRTDRGHCGTNWHPPAPYKVFIGELLNSYRDSLHSFNGSDGDLPIGGLVADADFYGTTAKGGKNNRGVVIEITAGK